MTVGDKSNIGDRFNAEPQPEPEPVAVPVSKARAALRQSHVGEATDPDARMRGAKALVADGDDDARKELADAARARALVVERNRASDKRKGEIDAELRQLGHGGLAGAPQPTVAKVPVGRRSPGRSAT